MSKLPFSQEELERLFKLESIFMPRAAVQWTRLLPQNPRFAHYTSAEAALSIIRSKRIWMRSTTCMSDYREVEHGRDIIQRFLDDRTELDALVDALNTTLPGVAEEAIARFRQQLKTLPFNTYITSISEHDPSEDQHGRLSMWRAFGGNDARVAMVFKLPNLSGAGLVLNLLFRPVAYLTGRDVHTELAEVAANIRLNSTWLQSQDRELIIRTLFLTLLNHVVCLKHEGFREEREWRAIYLPKLSPASLMESATECINGIPQIVYKIPLDKSVSDRLEDLDLAQMFDRLIVGPSSYPWVMYEAFVAALKAAGVPNVENRVITSDIPLRRR